MEEQVQKNVEKKITPKKRKVKTWGDEGFVGKVQYGCFDYDVRFVP